MKISSDDRTCGTMILAAEPARRRPPVLVVDDSKRVRDLMVHLLHLDGYRTLAADDGRAGQLLLMADRPSLIVTDLNMPRMNGWELLSFCRDYCPDIPVLVVSGEPSLPDELAEKPAAFLSKPFHPRNFRSEVERLLGSRVSAA